MLIASDGPSAEELAASSSAAAASASAANNPSASSTTSPGGSPTNATTPDSGSQTQTEGKKGTNVGAIVGGVVGGVCGLLLLLLLLWFFLRRKRRNEKKADDADGEVTAFPAAPPATLSSQDSYVKGSPFNSSDTPPPPGTASPGGGQHTHMPEIEYARDYEDVSNAPGRVVLPPQYREAWGDRAPAESSSEGDLDEYGSPARMRSRVLRDANDRATQHKRDVLTFVDTKGGMSTQ